MASKSLQYPHEPHCNVLRNNGCNLIRTNAATGWVTVKFSNTWILRASQALSHLINPPLDLVSQTLLVGNIIGVSMISRRL